MSNLLTGIINLSKIPADLIKENRAGEKIIYVDVAERRTPGTYGDTHYISLYDATNRQRIYIGDLKARELGGSSQDAPRQSAFPPSVPPATPVTPVAPAADDEDMPEF